MKGAAECTAHRWRNGLHRLKLGCGLALGVELGVRVMVW